MENKEITIIVGILLLFTGIVLGGGYEQGKEKEKITTCEPIIQEKVVEVEKEIIIDNTDNKSMAYCWIQRNELRNELVDKKEELKKTKADLMFLETLIEKERSYKDNRIDKCAEELDNISKSRDDCRKHEIELSDKLEECYK